MGLRLTLQNGSKILLDLPLSQSEWDSRTKEVIMRELNGSDADLGPLCEICDFFSNKRRVQMISHIVKDCDNKATFTDLLKVAVNPKYVSDLVNRSPGKEVVVKDAKGYSVSPAGLGSLLLFSVAARRMLKELNSNNDGDKSFEEQ